jgi:putative colanic acid biosynthesis UDP-glucose lipid carrier transferase
VAKVSQIDTSLSRSQYKSRAGHAKRKESISRKMVCDLVAFCEALLIIACGWIAKFAYVDIVLHANPPTWQYINAAILGAILSYGALKVQGLYEDDRIRKFRGSIAGIAIGLITAFFILIAMGFLFKIAHTYSRGWMLIWFCSVFVILLVERRLVSAWMNQRIKSGLFRQSVAIYGAGTVGQQVRERVLTQNGSVDFVGVFDDRVSHDRGAGEAVQTSGGLKSILRYGREHGLDRIIIALPASATERILQVMDRLDELPSEVYLCPDQIAMKLKRPRITYMGDLGLLEVQRKPMSEWAHLTKSVLDYIGSAALLVLLWPLMALIALAIKLESPGPFLYRQLRHGYNQRVISVLKFRTMAVTEDADSFQQARENDSRITRLGRVLRRWSLDELPQLINVMRGEMSLVGPRPHPLKLNSEFDKRVQKYANRHKVLPGITGLAQISGCRGGTETDEKMRKRVAFDLEYIKNWSILLDIKILLMTLFSVIRGENIY